jgi:hypothetical protein
MSGASCGVATSLPAVLLAETERKRRPPRASSAEATGTARRDQGTIMADERIETFTPEQIQSEFRSVVGKRPVPAVAALVLLADYVNQAMTNPGLDVDPHLSAVEDAKEGLRSALATLLRVLPVIRDELEQLVTTGGRIGDIRAENPQASMRLLNRLGRAAAETQAAATEAALLYGDSYRGKPGPNARWHVHAYELANLVEQALLAAGWSPELLGLVSTGGAAQRPGPGLKLVTHFVRLIDGKIRSPATVAKAIESRPTAPKERRLDFSEDATPDSRSNSLRTPQNTRGRRRPR